MNITGKVLITKAKIVNLLKKLNGLTGLSTFTYVEVDTCS